ncbi:unnamed protein product [Medioppia subpectinata]|uniref:Cytochrome P450 n=1 Tax=Medioppia subpectinata TaxID=1979941 RepID=A0A7R9LLI9_9ACAR|nr:unnamed protein product [Medioppia subpectinata]CAG2119864.1 unnamed protein product [Medioppia subpectinata]
MKTFPKVLEWTQFKSTDPKVENFFRSALTSMIANRKSMANRSKHNDYLQLMVNALNKTADNNSHITGNSAEEPDDTERIYGQRDEKPMNSTKLKGELTEDDILANTVLFLVAGYETTASLLSYLSYSLALNDKCQQKLYEEVMSFDGKYDYESISKMPYLEACVAETLRLYNPLVVLFRMANEDYKLGDTGITIPKGMMVNLDVQSIHRNPDYYPNPDRWDPERFLPENRDQLAPHSYMPFGIGPRNCVGMRFGLMEAKTAVVCLVQKFRFTRSVNTCVPLIPKKHEFILNCGEINIGVELRK